MRTLFCLVFCFLIVSNTIQAQSFQLIDLSNQTIVTGATIMLQSPNNQGWIGYESLNLYVKVINTSTNTISIGVKKIEQDTLQTDVQHTICFAGNCYPTSTFISPYFSTVNSGYSDSSFSGHYLFDNTVHIRGINHVSYVFYDSINPNDSVVLNVIYNTNMQAQGILEPHIDALIQLGPNPANDWVRITLKNNINNGNKNCFVLSNSNGKQVKSVNFSDNNNELFINTADLPAGMYFYKLLENNFFKIRGKLMVIH